MVLQVVVDPPLQGPDTEGRVLAHDRRGHEVGAEHDVEFVGGDLAAPEPVGKVPEGRSPASGL